MSRYRPPSRPGSKFITPAGHERMRAELAAIPDGRYSFVDYMDKEKILALSKEIPDTESLLRVALYTQNKAHVATLTDGYSDEKIIDMVETAQRKDLWPSVIGLLAHFQEYQHQRLASLVGRVSVDALLGMVPNVLPCLLIYGGLAALTVALAIAFASPKAKAWLLEKIGAENISAKIAIRIMDINF